MAGCGSERFVIGYTPAAIVVQIPAVSIGPLEGAGTTLTEFPAFAADLQLDLANDGFAIVRDASLEEDADSPGNTVLARHSLARTSMADRRLYTTQAVLQQLERL